MTPGPEGEDFATVAVPVPVRRLFTYRVAPALRERIDRGTRVRVPFGRRRVVGTVVEWPAAPPEEQIDVKSVDAVVEGAGPLPPEILELTRFVADYYLCSWGEAIEAATPPGQGARARKRSEPAPTPPAAEGSAPAAAGLEPTAAQAAVLEPVVAALAGGAYAPFLLFGATGSGKTEVYLRAARASLDRGRGVLYLVPEIGLTPLLAARIEQRFPGEVALLHSGLAKGERRAAWERARTGRCRLVVGTRSAVFAPVAALGLVVVDEEHDGSYKQEESPRYNARDMALVRAHAAGAVVLLGSATPSLESFRHARSGRYGLLRLGGRVLDRPLPAVQVVDMRLEYQRAGEVTPLSRTLVERLRECVARGEQALVLRNRRGWAAALICPTCGARVTCSRCSIALTWHKRDARLRCHFCAAEQRFPPACPRCSIAGLEPVGEGTERIEERIREALPDARVERMDRDTIRRRGAHEQMLRRFERGEIDVLVGTQMIAKGHDFPRVTLVGVLSADQALGMPDFRAAERAFQLLTQVAGRAGRGERPGVVVIQAFDPDHPLLGQAAAQDFESFYEREIRYRRALRYPPLSALVKLVVADREEHRARRWAECVGDALRAESAEKLQIGGPGPAPIERLNGRYRQQILVRAAGRRRLIAAVDRTLAAVEAKIPRRALTIDVDPYSML